MFVEMKIGDWMGAAASGCLCRCQVEVWKISDFVTFSSTNSDALLGRVHEFLLTPYFKIRDSRFSNPKIKATIDDAAVGIGTIYCSRPSPPPPASYTSYLFI